ncbi:TIGR03960 family B12-binding radical SAM protein [Paraliomyxa miuraensis]|uniref:TIGR03960 family B12-binding radical SAM protein n=1 Tax=Paraliomyxa miuraensis TaxID=376150 RepID=UPI002252E22C|nr:TIGR03960 family B12-binding radical SAM protein [Paraliomyxa miuraensis]MCX4245725.1 TIGR03960 family B12-binding radical SAM protein [Paraliomyxa miuraensis]
MDAHAPIPELPADPAALREHPYAELLPGVQKPGRYLGGEEQQIVKDHAGLRCRFVLAFPDLYEVGMSHLGTRILYDLINRQPDLVCERAFSPWGDLEEGLRARGLPLVSLETHTPLHAFDVVGVSLQYELCYTNVLLNLELGGIPLRSADRGDHDPIVLAGGPTATHPEPLTPFVDVVLVGEAEELLPTLLRTIGDLRGGGRPRAEVLAACARLPGIYVPSFYRVALDPRTGLQVVVGRTPQGEAAGAPERVERVWVRDLDQFPFPQRFPVPYAEAIFDRASVEITRGCTEGCRFCQAGIIYRPVRERSPEQVIDAVLGGVDAAGFSETSLTALSTADVSCIDPLIKALVPQLARRKAKLGVASLRAYGLSGELLDEIKRVGINGLTFAPEAGTQRMRDVINKNVSEEDVLSSARRMFERGYDRIKMYFIMGLPTETEADVAGIVQTGERVRDVARSMGLRRMPQITVSVSQHVPKPHTPFQWAAMDSMEDLHTKVQLLRELARRGKVGLKTHDVHGSWLECLFGRGDRRLGEALEHAYRAGARFEGWRECFSFERWLDALEAAGIDPTVYTRTLPVDARLPWDHIDVGIDEGFLADEYRKALGSRTSPPCGKPAGDQVHHRALESAQADRRRLVCYDCGIACDMTQMRSERIDSLRLLSRLRERQGSADVPPPAPEGAPDDGAVEVPLSRLTGRLAPSRLADDSAFKESAEAPHSRLRLVFAKHGAMRFLGHRDLLRVMPRMFRRAGIEQAFSRGFNPIPRMSFGPALALGVGALAEVVDVDVLLPRSAEDLGGMLSTEERETIAGQLLERLRAVAPPGLVLRSARLVGPDELRLGQLVAAADYAVTLNPEQAQALAARLAGRLAEPTLAIERVSHKKSRRGNKRRPGPRSPEVATVDVKASLIHARLDGTTLRFRLRVDAEGGARPREVVQVLLGERLPDHLTTRQRLLVRKDGALVSIEDAGVCLRPPTQPRPRPPEAGEACR